MENERVGLLNRVLHGTVNSVVQYIDIASPYVPEGCEEPRRTIGRIREEVAVQAHDLNAMISELDGVPRVGVFEYWNVDLNYLDLRFMARFAAEHQLKVIAELEAAVEKARNDAPVFGLLSRLLQEKRRHLVELQAIAPQPAAEPEAEPASE